MRALPIVALCAVVGCAAFWSVIESLMRDWRTDPNYSIGQLVPLIGIYVIWQDRERFSACAPRPSWSLGIGVLMLSFLVRAFGLLKLYESAERFALWLAIVAMVLLIGGRPVFRRVRWVLLFLLLMFPFPGRVHREISPPLQDLATSGAVFVLEVGGITVAQEGNVMVLNGTVPIAVVEACSGLRMLTAFMVVAATLALIMPRPAWQRVALVLSSIVVALACNVMRLVVTALLYLWTSSETAERFFHDFAGLTMMPAAVLILFAELWLMSRLVIDVREDGPTEQPGAA